MAVKKGDVVHYVNESETGGAQGHHLGAFVNKVIGGDPVAINCTAFFELGGQNPVQDHIHLLKVGKAYDATGEGLGTWHYREECPLGE